MGKELDDVGIKIQDGDLMNAHYARQKLHD